MVAAVISDTIAYAVIAAVSFLNGLVILPSVYYSQKKFDSWKPNATDSALKEEVAKHIEYGSMVQFIYDIFEKDKNSVNHSKCYLGEKDNVNEAFKILYPGFSVETLLKTNPEGLITEDDFTFFGLAAFNDASGELVVVYRGTVTESEDVEDVRTLGAKWRNVESAGKPEKKVSLWKRLAWGFLTGADSVVFHRGFKGVYTRTVPSQERGGMPDSPQIRLREVIDKLGSNIKKITVTGHSLGAATAVVCGLDLAQYLERKQLPAKVEIVSFACPKTGDSKLGKEFARLGVRHVHYLNRGDIVPIIMIGRYKHDSIQETRRLIPAWNDQERVIKKKFFHFFTFWVPVLDAPGLLVWHNLEYILYNMAVAVGLPQRDPAYLNKHGNLVDDRFSVPKHWFSPDRRVFVVGPDGKLKEDENTDRPTSFAVDFAKLYATYYKKPVN